MNIEKSNLTMGNQKGTNNVVNLFKGIIFSILITLVLLFAFAAILTYSDMQESSIPVVTIAITAISILIGSSISTIKINKNGIINGGIIGFVYIFLLYILSSVVKIGFALNAYSIVMMILAIVAGMVGGIVGVNIKKK